MLHDYSTSKSDLDHSKNKKLEACLRHHEMKQIFWMFYCKLILFAILFLRLRLVPKCLTFNVTV